MIKQPVRLIRLTYPERDVLLMKLSQFDNDIDAVYLLQKLSNQSANLLLTDDEIEALLDKLQMLRKDTDAQYLGEKIANQQTQLPSDVQAKISKAAKILDNLPVPEHDRYIWNPETDKTIHIK